MKKYSRTGVLWKKSNTLGLAHSVKAWVTCRADKNDTIEVSCDNSSDNSELPRIHAMDGMTATPLCA
jgi:hypothetical protein